MESILEAKGQEEEMEDLRSPRAGWFLLNIPKGGKMLPEVHTTKGEGIYPLLSLSLSLALCMNKQLDEETGSVAF